jgi:hypothetical protein
MRRSILAWALVLAATGMQPAAAQNEVMTPCSYALTNARIVVSPGNVIEQGTIVFREGRITAVGPKAQVPSGVIAVDVGGASVYAAPFPSCTVSALP